MLLHRALRLLRTEHAVSCIAALVIAFTQWFPAFDDPYATGFGDWQMIHHNWEAAFIALARFGEWPLWDPFHCGGVTILGNPESQFYAPLFFLSFLTGTVFATKVFLLLHIAAALLGSYWLARIEYRLSRIPAALAAIAWGLSGCFAWDGAGGHATFLAFSFAPWLLLCFRRIEHDFVYVVATASILALTLFEGGTYPLPYFVLLLAIELGRRLLVSGQRLAFLRRVAWLSLLFVLIGAIRLIPIAITLRDTPRTMPSTDWLNLDELLLMLTARSHPWRFPPHTYVWPEYGSYVGWPVLLFGTLGAIASLRLGSRHLLVGLVLFGLLLVGSRGPSYPWPLLHELPVYDSLRVPSRFAIIFTLYLALLTGVGLEFLLQRWPQLGFLRVIAAGLVAAQGADMLVVSRDIINRWDGPPLSTSAPDPSFHLVRERDYHFGYASYPRRNVGTDVCYIGGMNWVVSPALVQGRVPQARVTRGDGQLLAWGRTTRRVWAEVALTEPARVVFNQNFARGWVADQGVVAEDYGRLAIDLPKGHRRIELTYAPAWLSVSAGLSGLGLAIALAAVLRSRRRSLRIGK